MGEHKLREAGNGDTPKPVSSHIVEVVNEYADNPVHLAEGVEAAYTRLAERAKQEDSLIVSVSQSVTSYMLDDGPSKRGYVVIVLTAQRISREDFERQQRMAQIGPRR